MIVGLISSYREGAQLASTVATAIQGCDMVAVFEGPVGDAPETGEMSPLSLLRKQGAIVIEGEYASDAAKRTKALHWAQRKWQGMSAARSDPLWILWLDGDEVLIWPEFLRDFLRRAAHVEDGFNWLIRLTEFDGSVAHCSGKCIRGDIVEEYLVSSYQVSINGMVIALPNVPIWRPGEPMTEVNRPPLQGEPHILHRSGLRPPTRTVARLHDKEAEWFPQALRGAGLGDVA